MCWIASGLLGAQNRGKDISSRHGPLGFALRFFATRHCRHRPAGSSARVASLILGRPYVAQRGLCGESNDQKITRGGQNSVRLLN